MTKALERILPTLCLRTNTSWVFLLSLLLLNVSTIAIQRSKMYEASSPILQFFKPSDLASQSLDLPSWIIFVLWFEKGLVCLSYEMETEQQSSMMDATLRFGALTYAAEALVTMLASAIVKATLLAPELYALMLTDMPATKGESKTQSQDKQHDAEGEDGNDDEDEEDDDGDGAFGEGEDELSSEDGGGYGNNSNNKSNSKKAPEGGAVGADENGEEEDDEDGDDQDEDDDEDEDDDDEEEGGEGDEEEGVDEEDNEEEEEDEDEEALQPPKKRKK